MKKKIIAVISGTAILIIAAGSIYGKFESSHNLWKEDIEDGESVMTAEYRPVEYGKDYDVVNNPDKFQLYIDGKEIK